MLNSRRCKTVSVRSCMLAAAMALFLFPRAARAQVSPEEILNPDLKALEQDHFSELIAINRAIAKAKFPFPFYLSRYVGLEPGQEAGTDSRGIEFVRFQDRTVLKVTGNYNAAYSATQLTQNERASRTFHDVILPILSLVTSGVSSDVNCDAIGFEISYHSRARDRNYDYEGKEILVVVLDRNDAWAMARAANDSDRQEILNRSKVYVNGAEFGLSLTERDPLNVQALPRSVPKKIDASSTASASVATSRLSHVNPKLLGSPPQVGLPATPTPQTMATATNSAPPATEAGKVEDTRPTPSALTQADADRLSEKYQAQLDALNKQGLAKFHFVDYAPPAFTVFAKQMTLQMTLRNSLHFEPSKGSIYKRAAQSFDLFLAPQLKDLLEKIPMEADFQAFDFSVLNQLTPRTKGTNEAIEFICSREALLRFANAEITNQQLIDQSVVLVNGVRIALNLQLVE